MARITGAGNGTIDNYLLSKKDWRNRKNRIKQKRILERLEIESKTNLVFENTGLLQPRFLVVISSFYSLKVSFIHLRMFTHNLFQSFFHAVHSNFRTLFENLSQ